MWKFSSENEDSVFGEDAGSLEGFLDDEGLTESGKKGNDKGDFREGGNEFDWLAESGKKGNDNGDFRESGNEFDWLAESGKKENDDDDDIFKGIDDNSKGFGDTGVNDDNPWTLGGEEREGEHVFDIGDSEMSGLGDGSFVNVESEKNEEEKRLLEREEKELSTVLQGKLQFLYPYHIFSISNFISLYIFPINAQNVGNCSIFNFTGILRLYFD